MTENDRIVYEAACQRACSLFDRAEEEDYTPIKAAIKSEYDKLRAALPQFVKDHK